MVFFKAVLYCYLVFFISAAVSVFTKGLASRADLVFVVLSIVAGVLGFIGTRSNVERGPYAGSGAVGATILLWLTLGLAPIIATVITLFTTGAVAVVIPVGIAVMCLATFFAAA